MMLSAGAWPKRPQPARIVCVDSNNIIADCAAYHAALGGRMSPTLLEFAVAILLLVVAWRIGIVVAPMIIRWLRSLGDDVDNAAAAALTDQDQEQLNQRHKEEHTNGT